MQKNFNQLPDRVFLPAVMLRDIQKICMLKREEKAKLKPGEPDIIMESPLGMKGMIPRQILAQGYRYLNGKNIKPGGLPSNREILVVAQCEIPVFATFIPSKYELTIEQSDKTIEVNQGNKGKGSYLVCPMDETGNICRDKVAVVKPALFKKMFTIRGSYRQQLNISKPLEKLVTQEKIAQNTDRPTRQTQESRIKREQIQKQPIVQAVQKSSNIPEKDLIVIAKAIQNGRMTGFIMEDTIGNQGFFNKEQIIELCRLKRVKNAAVRNKDGKDVLYGINNCKLTELPEINI